MPASMQGEPSNNAKGSSPVPAKSGSSKMLKNISQGVP